jgi:hypothetical protein
MYDNFFDTIGYIAEGRHGFGVADVFLNIDRDRYNATVACINDIPGLALKATLPI